MHAMRASRRRRPCPAAPFAAPCCRVLPPAEYAVTDGGGWGNVIGAVSEAAFMTGMERNGDVVVMGAYVGATAAPQLFPTVQKNSTTEKLLSFICCTFTRMHSCGAARFWGLATQRLLVAQLTRGTLPPAAAAAAPCRRRCLSTGTTAPGPPT